MKCHKCGAENLLDSKFCKSCGEELKTGMSKEITLVSDKIKINDFFIRDRFKVIKKLGKGGMGEVFLCEDVKLKRMVAVKNILTRSMSDTTAKARFLREAQTASRLDHPNICTVYEVYEEGFHDYIVMQYVDGVTLDQIIKVKPIGIHRLLDIALQVCNGMVEAHENGIIHRDIKPGNIMVDKKGIVKILDFGLAKFREDAPSKTEDANLTEKGIVMGTVSYLSPEQASGRAVGHESDIFSFGILLYEMLEGENPFKEEEQIETLYNVLNKDVEFTRGIPGELEAIVRKTLEKDKRKRYESFAQLRDALELFRMQYDGFQARPREVEAGGTEVIDTREQQKMLREIQKTSDNEGLGDLVYRIKKFKASTERVYSTGKRKIKWFLWPIILIIVLLAGYFSVNNVINKKGAPWVPGPVERFYIYLHPFEAKTGVHENDLSQKIDYLLNESLDQFKEFKVIYREEAASILRVQNNSDVDPRKLPPEFKIKYELKGTISYQRGYYTTEGSLISMGKNREEHGLTITGEGNDSFLKNQVDNLTKGVYEQVLPGRNSYERIYKKVSGIYGTDWNTFSDFYRGYLYGKRMETDKARGFLIKADGLVIAKYYLADLLSFDGSRTEASQLVNEIVNQINPLTEPLKYRVLALQAQLDFNFQRQIENLEKLEKDFPFSREVFYALGEAYFHHGDAEKALEYYQKALILHKEYSNALNHMGYCYAYLGEHAKARQALEAYRKLDRTANAYDSFGDGYFYAGQYDDCESMKSYAVRIDEKSVPYSYQTLADIDILKARYRDAGEYLEKYNKIRTSEKNIANVLSIQAYIYYVNREYKKALETINRSIETFDRKTFNDNTAEAHWIKGLILLALNENEKSHLECDWLEEFKDKYKLSKDNFSAPFKFYIHLDALLMEREAQVNKADEAFKFLVNMKPRLSYWITYYHYQFFHTEYAAFLVRNNKYPEALREIETCLAYNTNYIPALWVKAGILEKANDPGAAAVYRKIAELYGDSTEKNYLRNLLKEKLK